MLKWLIDWLVINGIARKNKKGQFVPIRSAGRETGSEMADEVQRIIPYVTQLLCKQCIVKLMQKMAI